MVVELKNISKAFGEKRVIEKFSYSFEKGKAYAVTGASGSGKTTLLNLILGTLKPDTGEVAFPANTRFSCVWQEDRLCENLSAVKNAALVCVNPDIESINLLLGELGIGKEDRRRPVRDFSGGMKRRVALARALIFPSDVLILDEPFKGLDAEIKEKVIAVIKARAKDCCLILVTHDKSDIAAFDAEVIEI